MVKVKENEFFPADLIVLSSTEPEGVFYVETKNLDGETNLKLKSVSKDLLDSFSKEQFGSQSLQGQINIEEPNNRIYKFDGNFDCNSNLIPLNNECVALRGMSLRNTEHVTGVVVYTGHDSKI